MLHVLSDAWICNRDERSVATVLNLARTLETAFRLWVDVGRFIPWGITDNHSW